MVDFVFASQTVDPGQLPKRYPQKRNTHLFADPLLLGFSPIELPKTTLSTVPQTNSPVDKKLRIPCKIQLPLSRTRLRVFHAHLLVGSDMSHELMAATEKPTLGHQVHCRTRRKVRNGVLLRIRSPQHGLRFPFGWPCKYQHGGPPF